MSGEFIYLYLHRAIYTKGKGKSPLCGEPLWAYAARLPRLNWELCPKCWPDPVEVQRLRLKMILKGEW